MSAHQKVHDLFHVSLRRLCFLVGHDFFRGGTFEPNLHTYFIYAIFIFFFVCVVNTLAMLDRDLTLHMIPFIGLGIEVNLNLIFLLNFKINQ